MSPHKLPPGRLVLATALATVLSIGVSAPAHAAAKPSETKPAATKPAAAQQKAAQQKADTPTDPTAAAILKAKKTGMPVAVDSRTTQASTVLANPDSTLTLTSSSMPQRVKQGNNWVPVDTTLVKQKDGSYAPRAAATTLSIGAGGSTSLVKLTDGSRKLGFTWPGKLPEATVHGDTATYANVLPDVDLQVTADAAGYSSMLVVKTAAAAADPGLATLQLGLSSTGVKVSTTADGAQATDKTTGDTVFHSDTALMWDSSPAKSPAPPVTATGSSVAEKEHAAAQQEGGHQARIKVGLSGGKQTLTLDKTLLTAKTTKFPVYVDPEWSGSPSKSQLDWARISSNGWNYYNSTSTTSGTSARIGLDDFYDQGGGGEKARTYYGMNVAGIKGAVVIKAHLYVTERWAGSCSNHQANLYGTAAPAAWNSSGLNWDKQPSHTSATVAVATSHEVCTASPEYVTPAKLDFDVTDRVQTAATGNWAMADFLVQANSETDDAWWKQLGYGGGATLSVTYTYRPKMKDGTGDPAVKPSVADAGTIVTTTHTPTLSSRAVDPDLPGGSELVMIDYYVYNSAGTRVAYGYGPTTGYNTNGSDWVVNVSLPDGKYTWKATAKNAAGYWALAWGPTNSFTVDTTAPQPPSIMSSQFPERQVGAAYGDKGTFVIDPHDKTNNVQGYLFSMDATLASTTYASNKGTAWTATTTMKAGTIYYAKADNANGTGTVVLNGNAGLVFAPGTTGAHTLYVKSVDQAGSTSGQTPYLFYAGTSTPIYDYGDKLVSGWTATNTDGSTTVVPAATKVSAAGSIIKQGNPAGMYFGDGYQLVLSNTSTGSVAATDSVTMSFDVPSAGAWDIGANLTVGTADATWNVVLDQGKSTSNTLLANHDGYYPTGLPSITQYQDFGVIKDANGKPVTLTQGLHTLTFQNLGKNAASAGYQSGIDVLRLAPAITCTIDDTSKCRNNTAITTYTAGTTPTVTSGDADGTGNTLNAADLTAAGWNAGSTVTVDGAPIKLPSAWGTGASDNMLASGQTVTFTGSTSPTSGNALVFLGFATTAAVTGLTGTINYASACSGGKSQAYTISTVPDWSNPPKGAPALTLPHRNTSTATQISTTTPSLSAMSVPLTCPGTPIASITLPLLTNSVQSGVKAAHFIGVGLRPLSSGTGADGTAVRWVGSWGAAQDQLAVQSQPSSSSSATVNASVTNQTIRIPARLSLGTGTRTGDQVRVHLSNEHGLTPVTFDAASVALQDSTAGGAAAGAAPVVLTFGGSKTVTVPAGTTVVSDPVVLGVPPQGIVLVSLKPHGTLATMAGHGSAKIPVYLSPSDNVDHTVDQAATNFTKSTFVGLPFLSTIDVSTDPADPAGALVLYGDQTVNSDTATGDGVSQLSDMISNAFVNDPNGDGNVPFGIVNEGSNSWGNTFLLPDPATAPLSAVSLADREILSQSNVHTVLISSGASDLLTCTDTAANCATTTENKLTALSAQLRKYYADDAQNLDIPFPNQTGAVMVYVATIPPFSTTFTAAQETAREQVNGFINGAGGLALNGNADGVVDFAAAVSTAGNDTSSTLAAAYEYTSSTGVLYPDQLYYQALGNQYLVDAGAVDDQGGDGGDGSGGDGDLSAAGSWTFGEGTGTTSADIGGSQSHTATLHNATWGAGRVLGDEAATFNGTSSYAGTDLTIDTTQSFSVSAWVRLTDKSADRTVFSRDASGAPSFALEYQKSSDSWVATMPPSTGATSDTWFTTTSAEPAQTGVWTHLTAVYDSEVAMLTLYVDGVAESDVEAVTPFNDPNGAMWIGRGASTWFAGDMADVSVWQRAIDPGEVDALAAATPVADWEFDDGYGTTIYDNTPYGHNGTVTGGATWTTPGHNDYDPSALTLNGTTGAVTAGQVLRTDQSFTVSAWARLTSDAASATVLSQDGAHLSGFQVEFDKSCDCWAFVLPKTDSSNPDVTEVPGPAPVLNTWTQLTAVYDALHGTASLYVNGTLAATTPVAAEQWSAAGSFVVGRARWNDAGSGWFPGDVDAVHAYQGILTDDDITDLSAS